MGKKRTTLLVILDGFGVNPDPQFNSIAQANAPTWKRLMEEYPHGTLEASEHHVGLPAGFMGNSEVGHLNIGAGRVVYQDFSLISKAIQDGAFFENKAFLKLADSIKSKSPEGALHLMGLVSDGGVHSHISHLMALIQFAKRNALQKVYLHVFTDGRDTSPVSGVDFVRTLQEYCADAKCGEIVSVMGRFYAMDRDNRWDRTERAYNAMVGQCDTKFTDPLNYVQRCYEQNTTDEFLPPAIRKDFPGIQDGEGIIFFNFRADRARQITRAFTQNDFAGFRRAKLPTVCGFVCMTPYDETFHLATAFDKPKIDQTLGEVVSKLGWKQLRIAETEKYAHVTYFFNGGAETVFPNEKRVLIPSPREVKTYDLKPEMSAQQVTENLLKELENPGYEFVVVNFANPDMVGHTGNLSAAIRAVEAVDKCLSKIVSWVEKHDAIALITADHGNCEKMLDDSGLPLTAHTLLPVPLVIVDPKDSKKIHVLKGGKLSDIAPTLLALWGVKKPTEMTGRSIIEINQ